MRILMVPVAAAAAVLMGCFFRQPAVLEQDSTPVPGDPGGSRGYYGMLYVGDGQELRTGHELEMDDTDVNACLVENGGILTLEKILVQKAGDATGMVVSGGGHAACAVRSGGKLILTGQGNIVTEGYGAHGIYAEDRGSIVEADHLELETRGDTSAGVFLYNGAKATFLESSIRTLCNNAPCILLSGDTVFSGESIDLHSEGTVIEAIGDESKVFLSKSIMAGDISISEDSGLNLDLAASRWTGSVPIDSEASLELTMDTESFWKLTDDVTLSSFRDQDEELNNIDSDGFIIYYDYDNPDNEWIHGQTLPLPGGGFLTPMI